VFSSPTVSNGILYVGSEDDNVYALVASTGVLHWRFLTQGRVDSSPAVGHRACFRTCSGGQ
jgi:eukaryotic-like serine/threonine-protein kinase